MGWTTFGTNINPVTPIPRVDAPAWLTAEFYRYGDVVYRSAKHFQCIDGHTSGDFDTDRISGKWLWLTDVTDTVDMIIGINPLPLDAVKIIKNGVVLNRYSDYYFLNVRHDFSNARTTGLVGFRQALETGDVLLMQYDSSYADYIGSALLALDPRITALETKVGAAINVTPRLTTLESEMNAVESDVTKLKNDVAVNTNDILQHTNSILGLGSGINALTSRVLVLEKFFGGIAQVTIENAQATPLEIPEFEIDGNVYSSVRLEFEIQRHTGTEYRISTGSLHIALRPNGVWMTDRNITSFDMDGVEFTITTTLDKVGHIHYTSDLVAGASYVGTMKVRKIFFEVAS